MATQQIDLGKVVGPQGPQGPAGPGGKRYARIVIGTSNAGWTSSDCDYLCDGIDDQVEINAAISSLPSRGGCLVFLDGAYAINENILLKNYVCFEGNGFYNTSLVAMSDSINVAGATRAVGVSFHKIGLSGNGDTDLFNIANISDLSFSDCRSQNLRLNNCGSITISSCHLSGGEELQEALKAYSCSYISMCNCNIIEHVVFENCDFCTLNGNTFSAVEYFCKLTGTTKKCVVVGNTNDGDGVYSASTTANNVIANNYEA